MLHSPFPMLQTHPIMAGSIEITSFLLGYIYFFESTSCIIKHASSLLLTLVEKLLILIQIFQS